MKPLLAVDFEASCLGDFSYPIEAGIARWDGPGHEIVTWSALVVPAPAWVRHGDWTWEAQQVHGIAPADLRQGLAAHDVVSGLRSVAAGIGHAICDGGEHDMRWLVRLVMASGWSHLPFGLLDFDSVTMEFAPDAFERMAGLLETTAVPHRAGPDAVRLLQACVVGIAGTAAPVRVLTDRDVLPDS